MSVVLSLLVCTHPSWSSSGACSPLWAISKFGKVLWSPTLIHLPHSCYMADLARHPSGTGLTVLCFTLACALDLELLNMLEICMKGNARFVFVKFVSEDLMLTPSRLMMMDDDHQRWTATAMMITTCSSHAQHANPIKINGDRQQWTADDWRHQPDNEATAGARPLQQPR